MAVTATRRLQWAAVSDIGRRRTNNQDSHATILAPDDRMWRSRGDLLIVADGMGAHAAGELASRMAVEKVAHLYLRPGGGEKREVLREAIRQTNAEIHHKGQANPDFHNMGTTCSTLVLGPEGALIGHVGDSRIYRVRGGTLEQLTFDHSLVWEMRALEPHLRREGSALGLPKNVITRSLGPHAQVEVDIEGPYELEPGDVFLLCTDGLTGKITDEELGWILRYLDPETASAFLVDLANLRGGHDNITAVVVRIAGQEWSGGLGSRRAAARPGGARRQARWSVLAGLVGLPIGLLLWFQQLVAAATAVLLVSAGLLALGGALWWRKGDVPRASQRGLGHGPYVALAIPDDQAAEGIERTLQETADHLRQLQESQEAEPWDPLLQLPPGLAPHERLERYARAASQMARALKEFDPGVDPSDLFGF